LNQLEATPGPVRGLRAPPTLRAFGWFGATAVAAATAGAMAGRGELKVAVLPVAALLIMAFARLPVAGYVAILWSVATVVDIEALPQIGVSSVRLMPGEIILWIAVASLAFLPRSVRRELSRLAVQRESLIMGLFVVALVGGVAVGVENGATLHAALFDLRAMLFYVAFWPALAALTTNRKLVFNLVGAAAVVVVILQIIQMIVGPTRHLFWISTSDLTQAFTQDGTGFLRVRPPGLTMVYIVAAFALARVLWGPARHRLLAWGMAALTVSGVILSLNRNMVLGLALGLCAAAVVSPRKHRFVVLAATVGIAVLGFGLVAQGSGLASDTVVSRLTSISNYSQLRTTTLNDRYYEDHIAWQRIRDHPIGGLGWGLDYGAVILSYNDGFVTAQPRSFMHEQYLWIWMRAGIVGLVALVTALGLGIWNGARWCRARSGEADGWIGAGVVVSLVAMAASSNVAIYLTPPDSIVPLVGVLALACVMRRDLLGARGSSR
jgi:O-antigen ligase